MHVAQENVYCWLSLATVVLDGSQDVNYFNLQLCTPVDFIYSEKHLHQNE
jgi:hypothetical protein